MGIDTLELFMEGFGEYLADAHDERLQNGSFSWNTYIWRAVEAVCRQIDKCCLTVYGC